MWVFMVSQRGKEQETQRDIWVSPLLQTNSASLRSEFIAPQQNLFSSQQNKIVSVETQRKGNERKELGGLKIDSVVENHCHWHLS